MTIPLSESLQQAVEKHPGEPLSVVDPRTNAEYVLIRKETYDQLQQLVGIDPQAAYPLVDESFRDGWAEPKMADYDQYETQKRP